jgi:hypothetical protein
MRQHGTERFFAVAGAAHHGNVAFDLEQGSERAEHHALVFRNHDPDSLACVFGNGGHGGGRIKPA